VLLRVLGLDFTCKIDWKRASSLMIHLYQIAQVGLKGLGKVWNILFPNKKM